MSRLTSILASGAAVFALLAACSTERGTLGTGTPPPFSPDGGEAGAPPVCGFRCSRDLKKVLEGCDIDEGRVLAECPVGKGCGVDTCVDACESARLSKGSIGCSFWTLPPDDGQYGAGACYAAMVANTWDVPVKVTAEYGSDPLDVSKSIYTVTRNGDADPVYTRLDGPLTPGQVAIVFLAQADAPTGENATLCPPGTTPALKVDPIRHGTAKTKAFHLTTDAPVAAYAIFPYGGASSMYPTATLLLPVTSWDKSYIAVNTAKFGDAQSANLARRTLQIVANEDDTTIAMRPTVDIGQGENVTPAVTGEAAQWTLGKGQVLQITQLDGPAGSPIVASKPVGVFGGSPCTFLPSEKPYCDLTQQQIAPFAQWGSSYALVPYRSRVEAISGIIRETVPWSLVGAVDGTVLTYDPVKPVGAPETLSAGQIVSFETDAIVTVRSQDTKHPFHASVYMTGSTSGGGSPSGGRTLGDPEFVNLVPSDQFLDRYVFFTDFTYPETSLTVVRRKTPQGFKPVRLECGEIGEWQPIGTGGEFEMAWVRLTSGFVPQQIGSGKCGYGRHEATSEGPFGIYVWGIGKDASYGYAGGMGARPINDAPPPRVD